MKKHFITYGDEKFKAAKDRILAQAESTGWFDSVDSYGPEDVSAELKATGLMDIPRGGGLWSWKADIILSALNKIEDNDILVYADSGCSVLKTREWHEIEGNLSSKELIAQRIYQPTERWTRREIVEAFKDNPCGWDKKPQFCATVVIIRKAMFSVRFIEEWRNFIIKNPDLIKDVSDAEKKYQCDSFIENRHDQAIFSALVYKYIALGTIKTQWERIEDYDLLWPQAIRATRLRNGETEKTTALMFKLIKRYVKAIFLRPLFIVKGL